MNQVSFLSRLDPTHLDHLSSPWSNLSSWSSYTWYSAVWLVFSIVLTTSALAHPTIGTVALTWDLTRSTSVDEPLFSSRLKFYPSVQINLNQSKRPLFLVLFLGIVANLSLFFLSSKLPIPHVNLLFLPAHGSHTVSILWRWCWVLGVRNPQSIACEVWSHHFQDKLYNSDNLLIIFLRDTVTDYSLIMSIYVWNLILAYI